MDNLTIESLVSGIAGWNVQPLQAFLDDRSSDDLHLIPHNGSPPRNPTLRTLIIASGNPHKVAEIEAMLGPVDLEVLRQPADLDVEETGSTYLQNARLKASAAASRTGCWALADDSGLEVDALGGSPGIYTARFAATDADKLSRLIEAMDGVPYRSACFRSAMVLCSPDGTCDEEAEGFCWGELLSKPAYAGGGIESLFWVREAGCAYGQLNQPQLSKLGSRGKAARALAPGLRLRMGLT